jgi:hypothetical protein
VCRTDGRCVLRVTLLLLACGCGHGQSFNLTPSAARVGADWIVTPYVSFVPKGDEADSGPAALDLILARWGALAPENGPFSSMRSRGEREPETGLQLRDEARNLGFQSFEFKGSLDELALEVASGQPVLIKLAQCECRSNASFVVVVGCDEKQANWLIADPSKGWRTISSLDLLRMWSDARWITVVVFPEDQSILSAVSNG